MASAASRLRHRLALLLFALSLCCVAYFSSLYVGRRLWLGLLCTLALGTLLCAGLVSFAGARRRRLRDLEALGGAGDGEEAPAGTLLGRRIAELRALRDRGGRPDLGALAQRAQAELGGEAYFGRYFVAVAVLVGLLGTFAGLMETLSGVSGLLREESTQSLAGVLRLMATPLAGLHVTFGASMVGILATVTLGLLQGDLGVLDEELLARLEERTAHVLLPRLWPREEDPGTRAVLELAALRAELPRLIARIDSHAAEAAARIRESAERADARQRESAEAGLRQVLGFAEQTAQSLTRHAGQLGDLLDSRLRQGNEAMTAQARRVAGQVAELLERLGEEEVARAAARRAAEEALLAEVARAAAQAAEVAERAASRAAEAAAQATARAATEAAGGAAAAVAARLTPLADSLARQAAELAAAEERRAAAMLDGERRRVADHEALRQRLEALLTQGIAQPLSAQLQSWEAAAKAAREASAELSAGAQALGAAAGRFSEAAGALAPELAALAPELRALSAEVAVLGARELDAGDAPLLGLTAELCRLTDSIEQLLRRGAPAEHLPPAVVEAEGA